MHARERGWGVNERYFELCMCTYIKDLKQKRQMIKAVLLLEREIETDRERVSEAEVIETLLPPYCSHFRCMTSFQLVRKDSHNTSPHQCARQSTSEGGDNN